MAHAKRAPERLSIFLRCVRRSKILNAYQQTRLIEDSLLRLHS